MQVSKPLYPVDSTLKGVPVIVARGNRYGKRIEGHGWKRLQKHLAQQEKHGGWISVRRRPVDEPFEMDGYWIFEVADVDFMKPLF